MLIEISGDSRRFTGITWKGAGWIHAGTTTGHGRCDTRHEHVETQAGIWLRPLRTEYGSASSTDRTRVEIARYPNGYDLCVSMMVGNNEGMTKIYGRFRELDECEPRIAGLRRLHASMDRAVLNAYG